VIAISRRRRTYVALIALALLIFGLIARVEIVHHSYGVWAVSAGEAPPNLPFRGRVYIRGEISNSGSVGGLSRLGTVPSGGVVYGDSIGSFSPTGFQVKYPSGRIVSYQLAGAP
jgi:hypothetical protein